MAPRLISTSIEELLPMERSSGKHVSQVIRYICLSLGHFTDSEVDESTRARWELGAAFERAVAIGLAARAAQHDPDRYVQPGEFELDGLFGSPDLLDLFDRAVVEIKLTWMTAGQDPEGEKFWKYWAQAKSYAKMLGWRKARLIVAHINGSYRKLCPYCGDEKSVCIHVWEDEWSQEELDEHWRMIVSNAENVEGEVH